MSEQVVTVLGVAGSLRQASYNRGLIRAAQEVAPNDVVVEDYDIGAIPLYNGDIEAREIPRVVRDFAERIRAADAVLIATPEYNFGIPGVLKNAIDWVSRPAVNNPLRHKPVALMGAAGGNFGTTRAQLQLRQVLASGIDAYTLGKPDVLIARAGTLFDNEGNLRDEDTRERVRALLEALVDWTRRLRAR